jgi:hypothetical protein
VASPGRIFTTCALTLLVRAAAFTRPRTPASPTLVPSISAQALEYDVKAAYIFNLLPFTTWPPSAFASPSAPLTICVAQPDPFGGVLAQTFANEQVGTHPIVIKQVTSPGAVPQCHVLFIGADADANGALEQAAATSAVLTVGEGPQFERRGGIITFVVEFGRVRFDVSQTAAARVNIQLSSKVLQVARNIS